MKMIEKQIAKAQKDIERFSKAVARHTANLKKHTAKCEELNCIWTFAEWCDHRDAKTYTDDQYWAWDAMTTDIDNLEEAHRNLERAQKNLDALTGKAEANAEQQKESDRIDALEAKWWTAMSAEDARTEYEKWLKEFKAECLRDGITIKDASANWISGTSASGKRFAMYANNGMTERSLHCYTLRIEGETIFTSGDFSTGYRYLKH